MIHLYPSHYDEKEKGKIFEGITVARQRTFQNVLILKICVLNIERSSKTKDRYETVIWT